MQRDEPAQERDRLGRIEDLATQDVLQLACRIGIEAVVVEPGAPADGARFVADLFIRHPPFTLAVPGDVLVECAHLPVRTFGVFEDRAHRVLAAPAPVAFGPIVPDGPHVDPRRRTHGIPLTRPVGAQRNATPLGELAALAIRAPSVSEVELTVRACCARDAAAVAIVIDEQVFMAGTQPRFLLATAGFGQPRRAREPILRAEDFVEQHAEHTDFAIVDGDGEQAIRTQQRLR